DVPDGVEADVGAGVAAGEVGLRVGEGLDGEGLVQEVADAALALVSPVVAAAVEVPGGGAVLAVEQADGDLWPARAAAGDEAVLIERRRRAVGGDHLELAGLGLGDDPSQEVEPLGD